MINFKGLFKPRKEKENEIQLEIDLVNQYKNAISTLFKTVIFEKDSLGEQNAFYYLKTISDLSHSIDKELQSNKDIKTIKEIDDFNRITIDLLKDIVQFFIAVDNYNTRKQDDKVANDIKLFKTNINDGFKNIGQFDIKIKDYFLNKNSSVALKEYCLKVIKESFYFLNNNLYIEFEKCPIQSDYENLLFKLENSISSKDIESALLVFSDSKKRDIKFNDENDFVDFIDNVNDKIAFAQELKKAFKNNEDIHSLTASQIFNIDIKKVDQDQRRKAKAINFGIIYGISQYGLAKQINVSNYEAEEFLNAYFAKFPEIKVYMDNTIKFCRKSGYVNNIFGRRSHFNGINDKNFNVRNFQERAAINAPIQGSASEIMRLAMIRLDKKLSDQKNIKSKMLLQIHDELIFEVPKNNEKIMIKLIKDEMTSVAESDYHSFSTPLTVDINIGDNWGMLH